MNPAVFLDRDNTLIQNDGDLGDPAQVKLIQGAASAIASLRGLGFRVIVVTNQGGVARGKYTEEDVERVHQRINELVHVTSGGSIDRFYYCPYHPEGTVEKYRREHPWRKPAAGMLLQAAKDLSIELGQSWLVGDQMRDIEAGVAANVRTILLDKDADEWSPLQLERIAAAQAERLESGAAPTGPHFTARNMVEAVRIIAQQRKPESPDEMRLREKTTKRVDTSASRTTRGGVSGATPANELTPGAASAAMVGAPAVPMPVPTAVPTSAPRLAPRPAPPAPATTVASAAAAAPPATPAPPSPLPIRVSEALPADASPIEAASRAPAGAPDPVAPRTPTVPEPAVLLTQILQELRNHRGRHDDFPATKVIAIVVQSLAIVFLMAALWLGQVNIDTFIRWIGVALIVQLVAIWALLFSR